MFIRQPQHRNVDLLTAGQLDLQLAFGFEDASILAGHRIQEADDFHFSLTAENATKTKH